MKQLLPDVPQAGIFDTAYHQTMPEHAYMYAIPYSLYKKYGIRRYGFHGTSHRYVSQRACEILGVDYTKQKIITCHLGNGASIAAIKNGKSIDTSMGLTPIEGLMMGTRAGDFDLGALFFIMNKEGMDVKAANAMINKQSGVLGISGVSSDMREVEEAVARVEIDVQAVLLQVLQQRAPGAVNDALGRPGRAGGIQDVQRVIERKRLEPIDIGSPRIASGIQRVEIIDAINRRGSLATRAITA